MLVAICAVSILPYEQLGKSDSPLAAIAENGYGTLAILIISIIALFATSNTILSNMLGSSRVLLNMSRETKALKAFSKVSEKSKTPVSTLILILIVMAAFTLIGNIETIARIANIFIFITFIVVNISVIVLRIKEKDMKRPFRIPFNVKGVPVIPVLGALMTLLLFSYNFFSLIG